MRNLIILGCAALLAIGLSAASFAGSIVDADNDGVPDDFDNCVSLPNGPLALDPAGCGQTDGDQDGFGNACDADLTNNNIVDLPDISGVLGALGTVGPGQAEDLTCNDVIDLPDLSAVLGALGGSPGPSGLACAGTVPCTN